MNSYRIFGFFRRQKQLTKYAPTLPCSFIGNRFYARTGCVLYIICALIITAEAAGGAPLKNCLRRARLLVSSGFRHANQWSSVIAALNGVLVSEEDNAPLHTFY